MINKKPLIKQGWVRALAFIIFFLVLNFLLSALLPAVKKSAENVADIMKGAGLIFILTSSTVALASVFLFRTFIDRQSVNSLGLNWAEHQSSAATGFFLAPLILGAGTLILIMGNFLHWSDIHADPTGLFLVFGLMVIIAFAEELVFRGYLLNNLLQSVDKWVALAASSLIFAVFHASNNGFNIMAMINLFLAGMILGINYIYTRNLWFGILFHVSWNFYQGAILGYRVSGVDMKSLLDQELTGNELLTGGNFGFEGSSIAAALILAALLSLAWIYEKRYKGKVQGIS